jgi:hypothetical protein
MNTPIKPSLSLYPIQRRTHWSPPAAARETPDTFTYRYVYFLIFICIYIYFFHILFYFIFYFYVSMFNPLYRTHPHTHTHTHTVSAKVVPGIHDRGTDTGHTYHRYVL